MAEAFNDLTLPDDKAARYATVAQEIASVLDGEPNRTARMATIASMLAASFEHYFWTGFYVVDPDRERELVVGPYQGTLGCLRIA
ncbi:MAG: GAF domain-containing protein, partial [Phenylobacterium sp.]|nr:GAF domain-containing protein [Phenylobacterium sp.]